MSEIRKPTRWPVYLSARAKPVGISSADNAHRLIGESLWEFEVEKAENDSDRRRWITTAAQSSERNCPKCGGRMKTQMATVSGKMFLGCLQYPTCTGTENIFAPRGKPFAKHNKAAKRSTPVPDMADLLRQSIDEINRREDERKTEVDMLKVGPKIREDALTLTSEEQYNPDASPEQVKEAKEHAKSQRAKREPKPDTKPDTKPQSPADALFAQAVTQVLEQEKVVREADTLDFVTHPELDEALETLAARIDAKADSVALPQRIEIVIKEVGKPDVTLEGHQHMAFEPVFKRAMAGQDTLIVGPAGCGKTKMAEQIAEALDARFGAESCTEGMTESVFTGRRVPIAGGAFGFEGTDFLDCVEVPDGKRSVFLLDELDGAGANVLLVFNQLLANGRLPVPNRIEKPYAKRASGFVLIAAANTYGNGADRQYVGRNQLDASTLDRFACNIVEMDYDPVLEQTIVSAEVYAKFKAIRDKVRASKLRRIVSTRAMLKADVLMGIGEKLPKIVEGFLAGWTAEEKARVS